MYTMYCMHYYYYYYYYIITSKKYNNNHHHHKPYCLHLFLLLLHGSSLTAPCWMKTDIRAWQNTLWIVQTFCTAPCLWRSLVLFSLHVHISLCVFRCNLQSSEFVVQRGRIRPECRAENRPSSGINADIFICIRFTAQPLWPRTNAQCIDQGIGGKHSLQSAEWARWWWVGAPLRLDRSQGFYL